jgi:hypothetical protein
MEEKSRVPRNLRDRRRADRKIDVQGASAMRAALIRSVFLTMP